MTKRAAIGQPEIDRVLKACKRAGYEKARVHVNLIAGAIDIMLGEDQPPVPPACNPWDGAFKKPEGEAMLERVRKRLKDSPPVKHRSRGGR